jgi:hypothetical protein
MSRTKKGEKSPGTDFWGKRAMSGSCGTGKIVKKITHGKERAATKHIERKAKKDQL